MTTSVRVDRPEPFDDGVWQGVQSLLDDYVDLRAEDLVIVLHTSDAYQSAAWVSAALEIRDAAYRRVWMAPLVDEGLPVRLAAALPAPEELAGRLVLLSFERDTMSHGEVLRRALSAYDARDCLVLRAISAAASLFQQPLRAAPPDLEARNTALLEQLMSARSARITTPSGSDLRVTFDPSHRWISNRGTGRPGSVLILPAGEVATYPADIDGVFVADFAFNVNAITDLDARLEQHPATVTVHHGRAVNVSCSDAATSQFLDTCLARENATFVGELGFGTNPRVTAAISMNSHTNERRPGVHLGFGQHNQSRDVVPYQSPIHVDLIARGGLVHIDDGIAVLDLMNLPEPAGEHPGHLLEQDVSSASELDLEVDDCCGLIDASGLHLFDRALDDARSAGDPTGQGGCGHG